MAQGIEKLIINIKKFIKKLQRSDDKTKKRWLIASSAISMVIIFFLWLTYLNAVVMPGIVEPEKTATATVKTVKDEQKKSFFKTFSIGLKTVTGDLKKQFLNIKEDFNQTYNNFKNQIQKKNEFILEKSDIIQDNQNQ